MDLALAIAKTGLEAQHQNLEIISNNLANANTPAYKKSRASFQDLPYQVVQQPGAPTTAETNSPTGKLVGTGSTVIGNPKSFKDGDPVATGRPLDIQITGRGFIQVQLPNGGGTAYTRAGSLQVNETGQVTDSNGYVLQPAITIPQNVMQVFISTDGIITGAVPGSTTAQQIGQLQLADFINQGGLQPIGNNLYLQTTASGTATLGSPKQNGLGSITQGYLEGSNVNVVEEMVDLIEAQRAFEVTSKAVSAVDNMMQNLTRQT